ncbi:MAG: ATP-dependent Clp protease ATP-binding subunit [Alphaproteobacteria bacterium]|nr:ATP-dependent Clp protease ATP-binding subunit [Alphaproteobacteria bacterium]
MSGKYIVDYTEKAKDGTLKHIVGREKERRRIMHILLRDTKNNPMLLGTTGIGKTSIVEGFAECLYKGNVPPKLKGHHLVSVDIASMMIDSKTQAEYEDHLKTAFQEIQEAAGKMILFINDLGFLAKTPNGNPEIPKFLKPKVLDGGIKCVVEAELNAFKQYIEQDPDLMSCLQTMYVEEPNPQETTDIISDFAKHLEQKYEIKISDEIVKSCVTMSGRYVKSRLFPEKAIDLLDEAATGLMMDLDEGKTTDRELHLQQVANIISLWTGIPMDKVDAEDKQRLIDLENFLGRRVIGQPEAISVISGAVRRMKSGLQDPNRPLGTFLFIGTTGVGKTELAKALSEFMFDDETALLRLDMSEYMEKSSVQRMLGPPPGTPGFEKGGVLTEAVRLRPYQVVLFDELEKAHSDILNLMLQLLDEGRLTDGKGLTVDFKNTVVIMTSNLGANLPRYQRMEFLRKNLRPEFLARIDDIIPFHGLAEENLLAIVDIHLNKFVKRAKAVNVKAELTLEARKWFADEVFIAKNGVREIKRLIQHHIENPLSVLMMYDKVGPDDLVKIIRPKDKKGVEIVVLKPGEQDKELDEAVTIEKKMDDGVDDRPPPPPTFKLNSDGDENSDLPAWKRAQMEAQNAQSSIPAENPAVKKIKMPVIKAFKSTLGKGLGGLKIPTLSQIGQPKTETQSNEDVPNVQENVPDLPPSVGGEPKA